MTDALRTHCAEGRLAVQELEQRLARALGSRTVAELDALVNDLPTLASSAEVGAARSSRLADVLPGVRHFYVRHVLSAPCARVFAEARQDVAPAMTAAGYDLIKTIEGELMVFDDGRDRVVIAFSDAPQGTVLTAQGHAPRRVRKAFAGLMLG